MSTKPMKDHAHTYVPYPSTADELNRLYRRVSESATSLEWAELEQEPD